MLAAQVTRDLLAANIDTTVSPRQDFFQYATGEWLKRNPIPEDRARWGPGDVGSEDLYARVRRASEAAAATRAPRGRVAQLIGDFWSTGMDSTAINRQGLAPLRADLDGIDSIHSIGDVIDVVAILHRRNMLLHPGFFVGPRTLFSAALEQDEMNTRRRIMSLSQGGISLGPQVYSATDPQRVKVRDAFREYLFETFVRLHPDSLKARASADAVFDLEARMARAFSPANEYHMLALNDLSRLTPTIDWNRYFGRIGAIGLDSVNVRRPGFFQALDSLLRVTPLETWRSYLKFCLVRGHAQFLDDATFNELFAFQSASTGARQPRLRWKRIVWQEKNWLGQPLGQLIAREDAPGVNARYRALAESLRQAFRNRILRLDWMSDSTKQKALLKLDRLRIRIGFPREQWLDVSTMPLRRDSFVLNMIRSAEWFHTLDMKQLRTPVQRGEVDPSYNVGGDAWYDYTANDAWLPGPLSDGDREDAFVYGVTVLSHEISHAFDSNGRDFDAEGNKVNWWTAADSAAFDKRAQLLIDEYNEFMPIEGRRIDGRRSLAENMAELVGVRIALDAFKKTAQYQRNEKIAGFTPLQRFFLAYAYSRACQERPAYLATTVGGAYAPCRERVNGVLMNIPEFYEAFNVRPGDSMYRAETARANVW